MSRPELRIGDAERESALSALSEHYVAGRLTKEEYDERCESAWRARTGADLTPLFADLPALPGKQGTRPVPVAAGPTPTRRVPPSRRPRVPVLPLLLVLVGLAVLTEVWVVLVLFGLLWWTGTLRWITGRGPRPRHGCGHPRTG